MCSAGDSISAFNFPGRPSNRAANPIVRFPWRGSELSAAEPSTPAPELIPEPVLEQTWSALEPLLNRREDRRK